MALLLGKLIFYEYLSTPKHLKRPPMMTDYKLAFAELFVRVFAGILFLFQGYDKLFHIKMQILKGIIGKIHAFWFLKTIFLGK